jgi:hypothetical protein
MTAETGQQVQDDWRAITGLPGQNTEARTGHRSQDRTQKPGQNISARTAQLRLNSQNRTDRTEQPDSTVVTGQLGQG